MAEMDFDSYQVTARSMAVYTGDLKILYPAIGLSGEAGELLNKVKKVLRDAHGVYSSDAKKQIAEELGDCLWYCAALAGDLGFTLAEIAEANIHKLKSRKERGTLQGSGDNR